MFNALQLEKLQSLQNSIMVMYSMQANPVSNFGYQDSAIANSIVEGTFKLDNVEYDNSIPDEILVTTDPDTGIEYEWWTFIKDFSFRTDATQVVRILLNHIFGRMSYNLNKVLTLILQLGRNFGVSLLFAPTNEITEKISITQEDNVILTLYKIPLVGTPVEETVKLVLPNCDDVNAGMMSKEDKTRLWESQDKIDYVHDTIFNYAFPQTFLDLLDVETETTPNSYTGLDTRFTMADFDKVVFNNFDAWKAETPVIYPGGGIYDADDVPLISISTEMPNTIIWYTLDGSSPIPDPDNLFPGVIFKYTAPFTLPNFPRNRIINAIASKQDMDNSEVTHASFEIRQLSTKIAMFVNDAKDIRKFYYANMPGTLGWKQYKKYVRNPVTQIATLSPDVVTGNNAFTRVYYFANKYFGFTDLADSSFYTSTNGLNWTKVTMNSQWFTWKYMAYGNGWFVIVGNHTNGNTYSIRSNNGVNWESWVNTQLVMQSTNGVTNIVFVGSRFMTMVANTKYFASTNNNAASWTSQKLYERSVSNSSTKVTTYFDFVGLSLTIANGYVAIMGAEIVRNTGEHSRFLRGITQDGWTMAYDTGAPDQSYHYINAPNTFDTYRYQVAWLLAIFYPSIAQWSFSWTFTRMNNTFLSAIYEIFTKTTPDGVGNFMRGLYNNVIRLSYASDTTNWNWTDIPANINVSGVALGTISVYE